MIVCGKISLRNIVVELIAISPTLSPAESSMT
jgi:hypothetical protein